jgi:HEAT repeat protein
MAAPPRKLEERLSALKAMERAPEAPDEAVLREALGGKSGMLVAAAARIVAGRELRALVVQLPPAFTRLCERPVERDPGCRGKIAIARALRELDAWEDEVFARGIALVQEEPVWGGREDTAAELRAECAMAFAHAGRDDALDVLADLLADPQRAARAAAAQALGDTGRPDASALLRYKVRIGDPEAEVIAACLGSLLALSPRASLPFVASLLSGRDERATSAALALGESRLAAAAPYLLAWVEEAPAEVRARIGYLALALLRDEAATAFLLGVVRESPAPDAIAAAKALATFRDDARLADRLREAAGGRERVVVSAIEAALEGVPR